MYEQMPEGKAASWNQVEQQFLNAMSEFDRGLVLPFDGPGKDLQGTALSAALQNGKGDWFNNVLASLLERCSGVEALYLRRRVPGLIIPEHNLDGVYPGDESCEIQFLLEAKMMGTPKHPNSSGEKPSGRPGSADTGKRVKELAFKSIDLKGEAARRRTMQGVSPAKGVGGGDLSTWLHASLPRIYFFMAVRVVSDKDFAAVVRWAEAAAQVVDAVGLFCYEPVPGSFTDYRSRSGVPTAYELERVLFRACTELQDLKDRPYPAIPAQFPPGPALQAEELAGEADS